MPTVTVNGEQLHYQAHQGHARAKVGHVEDPSPLRPPLLLVHGAGGTLMHWPAELRRLPGYAVYALDLPGHGGSGGRGRSEVGAYAEVVRGFARALGLGSFVLAGHSMGGAIALELALQAAEGLAGLVLVSTGARLRVAPESLAGLLDDFDAAARLIAERTHAGQVPPEVLELYVRRLRAVGPAVTHCDFLACNRFDQMAAVSRIVVPTLVICGAADRMTPVRYSRYLAEQIPAARLVIIPGGGHMALLQPTTSHVVVAAVRRFLEDLLPPQPAIHDLGA